MSFAGFQINKAQEEVDLSFDMPYNGSAEDFPLISKLLEVSEYKELYHQYLEKAVKLYFKSGVFVY